MRHSGRSDLLDRVINETIPMKGRMVHGRSVSGELTEQSQDYDAHGRVSSLPSPQLPIIKHKNLDIVRSRPRSTEQNPPR